MQAWGAGVEGEQGRQERCWGSEARRRHSAATALPVPLTAPHPPACPPSCPWRSKLVQNYSQQAAGRPPTKFAKPAPGGRQLATFRRHSEGDAAWEAGWREYHAAHARLAALCKDCSQDTAEQQGARPRQQQQRRQR